MEWLLFLKAHGLELPNNTKNKGILLQDAYLSMPEFDRSNLIAALELNDESKQGLPAASIASVSPVGLCIIAAPVPSFTGS